LSTEAPKLYAWWTPGGWENLPAPEPFPIPEQVTIGWDEAFSAAGYSTVIQAGDTSDYNTSTEVKVSVQTDGHLHIAMWAVDTFLAEFFVAEAHRVSFIVDRLPTLLRDFAHHEAAIEMRRITKAILAFIRHGHGEDTIDEDGEFSRDDRIRAAEQRAHRRARETREAAEAAKAAKP
jgi:hypothetical protein